LKTWLALQVEKRMRRMFPVYKSPPDGQQSCRLYPNRTAQPKSHQMGNGIKGLSVSVVKRFDSTVLTPRRPPHRHYNGKMRHVVCKRCATNNRQGAAVCSNRKEQHSLWLIPLWVAGRFSLRHLNLRPIVYTLSAVICWRTKLSLFYSIDRLQGLFFIIDCPLVFVPSVLRMGWRLFFCQLSGNRRRDGRLSAWPFGESVETASYSSRQDQTYNNNNRMENGQTLRDKNIIIIFAFVFYYFFRLRRQVLRGTIQRLWFDGLP
jgi:hypothetical protein